MFFGKKFWEGLSGWLVARDLSQGEDKVDIGSLVQILSSVIAHHMPGQRGPSERSHLNRA